MNHAPGEFSLIFLPFGFRRNDIQARYGNLFWSDDIDRRLFKSLGVGPCAGPKFYEQIHHRPDHVLERFLRIARNGRHYRWTRGEHLHIAGDTLRATAPLWHVLLAPKALISIKSSLDTEIQALVSDKIINSADEAALAANLCRRSGDSYWRAYWPDTQPIYL